MIPIILSGGTGSRLWPLSRALRPKQFLGITAERSLFQLTLQRLQGIPNIRDPLIVANHEHRFLAAEQCRAMSIRPSAILLEPIGRNTAPAIAAAVLHAMQAGEDPVFLVMPSDHIFGDVTALQNAINTGASAAQAGQLATFGIVPTAPETGYGYVRAGVPTAVHNAYSVAEFIEKPDLVTAHRLIASKEYYWNSGMFMFRGSTFITELKKWQPEIYAACRDAVINAKLDLDFFRLAEGSFESCPANSIDYAVMEKTEKSVVIPLDAGWSDVGAWPAVWEALAKDDKGNAKRGDVMLNKAESCYVHSEHRLVALLGTKNLVVVETSDAVLVAEKSHAQDVKEIVNQLRICGRSESELHREVFRPWGSFDSIDRGQNYQVKRITVNPGGKLSLQLHKHRAEHWVVVKGTARVTIGDDVRLVEKNQSVFIPIGEKHSLENPSKEPLELIEVQSGTYLGEDDIIRLSDVYGRKN